MHEHYEATMGTWIVVGISALIVCWFVIAIARTFDRWFGGAKEPDNADLTAIHAARELLIQPRPVLGSDQWVRYEVKPVICEAPMPPSSLTVHNRQDPEHLASCPECRDGLRPRYSGVSHRAN